ncbi:hypothetical protein JCM10908_004153 [Rhodotorula pacifica]|uniref:glycoside hydrolase family 47 protein n=1 Tax=Rhodotorula pacifica TaxID=1495444 RepID=UPI003180AF70
MLPTRRRSPPSYSRLASTPNANSPANDEKDARGDGSDSSGYSWSSTSERPGRPGLAHQRSFDFDIEGSTGREPQGKEGGQGAVWPAATTMLQRQARTFRGKAILGIAALALVMLVRNTWQAPGAQESLKTQSDKETIMQASNTTALRDSGATAITVAPPRETARPKLDYGSDVPEYDESAFVQPRRAVPPAWPDPWAHVENVDFQGRAWLSPSRFGSDEEGWKQTRDPPEQQPPPARHLLKAFEFTAEAAGRRKDGLAGDGILAPGVDFDDMTGRPKMVPREVLKLGKEHGWRPPRGFLASEIGTKKQKQADVPRVQYQGAIEGEQDSRHLRAIEEKHRRGWVKRAFMHAWEGYSTHAYGHDELSPVSKRWSDNYNGWGATLVDSLDTLLMMDMSHEYTLARKHVADIDFTYLTPTGSETFSTKLPNLAAMEMADDEDEASKATGPMANRFPDPRKIKEHDQHSPATISWFETTIRYLGGLLSAYELSADPLMLERATELGNWLLPAFATEHGLPVNRYMIGSNPNGAHNGRQSLAEVGSMILEMTRLSQLTGDEVYFRAAQRAHDTLEKHFLPAQEPKDPSLANGPTYRGRLGTLLPAFIDPSFPNNLQGDYTLGGLADSYYEYLIKQAHLTSLSHEQSARMYREAMDSILQYLVRPLEVIPGRHDLALLGTMNWGGWQAELQHLACFAGGMFGLGAKLLGRPHDLDVAINVTNACIWVYESSVTGIGGESTTFYSPDEPSRFVVLDRKDGQGKQLSPRGTPPGVRTANKRQIGRPETIESVFYMYRLTGERKWQDQGWTMFVNWVEHAITETGFATVKDINHTPVRQDDSMESFVLGETLKYYHLLFSPRDYFSLDDWVFSTEAHPFWRARPGAPRPSAPPLWAGPDSEPDAVASFTSQMGEGTWVQKWARVRQAADLAPKTLRRTAEEKARAARLREDNAALDPDSPHFGRRPPGGARRPLVRPSEDELVEARRRKKEQEKANPPAKMQPPVGQAAGGGGRGMAGGGHA